MFDAIRRWHLSDPRKLWTGAFVLWLCVVWGHSLMTGDVSSAESSRSVNLLNPFLTFLGCGDEETMTFVVRKTAHFLEYAVLVALGRRMACEWFDSPRLSWLVTGAIWIAAPCVDETLQLLVPGRTGKASDVLLDMAGGLFGLFVLWLIHKARAAYKGKRSAP